MTAGSRVLQAQAPRPSAFSAHDCRYAENGMHDIVCIKSGEKRIGRLIIHFQNTNILPAHQRLKRVLIGTLLFTLFLNISILLSASQPTPESLLIKAVNSKDLTKIKALLSSGVNHNLEVSQEIGNLLHLAAFNGAIEASQILLQAGTNLNHQNITGQTPLHCAIHNNPDFAIFLIKNNANLTITDKSGYAPIHIAAKKNDLITLKTILDSGFDANFVNSNHESALFYATLDAAKLLIHSGAKVSLISKMGITPIFVAPEETSIFLIEEGADFGLKKPDGQNILHSAIERHWSKKGIDYLLEKGVNINAQDNAGRTPLHLALLAYQPSYEHLILKGANCSIRDKSGVSPESIMSKRKWEEVKEFVKQYFSNRFF